MKSSKKNVILSALALLVIIVAGALIYYFYRVSASAGYLSYLNIDNSANYAQNNIKVNLTDRSIQLGLQNTISVSKNIKIDTYYPDNAAKANWTTESGRSIGEIGSGEIVNKITDGSSQTYLNTTFPHITAVGVTKTNVPLVFSFKSPVTSGDTIESLTVKLNANPNSARIALGDNEVNARQKLNIGDYSLCLSSCTITSNIPQLSNVFIAIQPVTTTSIETFNLSDVILTLNYKTRVSPNRGVIQPASSNSRFINDPNTTWTDINVPGLVKLPAGSVAKIQWFAADTLEDLQKYPDLTSPVNCAGRCSDQILLSATSNQTKSLKYNGVDPKGKYGKFVLALFTSRLNPVITDSPSVNNNINVYYTTAVAPSPLCETKFNSVYPLTVTSPATENFEIYGMGFSKAQFYIKAVGSDQKYPLTIITPGETEVITKIGANIPNGNYFVYAEKIDCPVGVSPFSFRVYVVNQPPINTTCSKPSIETTQVFTGTALLQPNPSSSAYTIPRDRSFSMKLWGKNFGVRGEQSLVYLRLNGQGTQYNMNIDSWNKGATENMQDVITASMPMNMLQPGDYYNIYVQSKDCNLPGVSSAKLSITGTVVTPPPPPPSTTNPVISGIKPGYMNNYSKISGHSGVWGTFMTLTGENLGDNGTVSMVNTATNEKLSVNATDAGWAPNSIVFNIPPAGMETGASEVLLASQLDQQLPGAYNVIAKLSGKSNITKITYFEKPYYFIVTPTGKGSVDTKNTPSKYITKFKVYYKGWFGITGTTYVYKDLP